MREDAEAPAVVGRAPRSPHPLLPPWVGDLVAAALIIGSVFAPFPGPEFRPDGWMETLLVILPAGVLPFRRRWPIPVLAVCLGFYGTAAVLGLFAPGVALAVAIAMFGVANRSTRRVTIVVGGITVVVVFLLTLPIAAGSVFDPRLFQFVLATALAAAAGDATRSQREYITAITERAERAEQTREAEAHRRVTEERLRIARDLHDAVAHQIAVISLNAGVASSSLEKDPGRARDALGTIRSAARTVLGEIGDLLSMLRGDDSGENPIDPQHGLDQLDALLEQFRTTGLDVRTRTEGDVAGIGGGVGLVAYRVVQEALTNAHKHGAENRAHLLVEATPAAVRIVVTNPTPERPRPDEPATGSAVGLVGLRERVASVRGRVEAGPVVGGWKLTATIPLAKEDAP